MTTWTLIATAGSEGNEAKVTLSEMKERPDQDAVENAYEGIHETYTHFFGEHPGEVSVVVQDDDGTDVTDDIANG